MLLNLKNNYIRLNLKLQTQVNQAACMFWFSVNIV